MSSGSKTRKAKIKSNCPFSSKVDTLYRKVLRSYKSPKVRIVRKLCGKKAFEGAKAVFFPEGSTKKAKKWAQKWSPSNIKRAKGFLYTRRLRKNKEYGFKLISISKDGESVIGQREGAKDGPAMFAKFK